jgi:hypothetical protein
MAIVDTSATLALAALEVFVHVVPSDAPVDLVAFAADIPDEVAITRLRSRARRRAGEDTHLPRRWRRLVRSGCGEAGRRS